jgi:hypothetical protein
MSGGKFASITAGLLARKGDARPSILDLGQVPRSYAWASRQPSEDPSGTPPKDEFAVENGEFVRIRAVPEEHHDLRKASVTEEAPVAAEGLPAQQPAPDTVVAKKRARKKAVKSAYPAEPAHTDRPRRLFVNLTPSEYERLGIVAVKRDTSRHHLLREALNTFMDWAAEEYRTDCACVGGNNCRDRCS